MTRRGDSGRDGQRRPLRKWGSRSGGGPVRPPQARPEERTQSLEHTRRLDPRPPAPPRGRYDDRFDAPAGDRYGADDRRGHPGDRHPDQGRSGREGGGHQPDRYRDRGYPDDRYGDRGYPDDRYPDDRYRDRGYPDDRYPDDRYRDRGYPDDRYRDERHPGGGYPDRDGGRGDRQHPGERYAEDRPGVRHGGGRPSGERYRDARHPDGHPDDHWQAGREPPGHHPGAAGPPPVPPTTTVPKKLTVTRVAAARVSYLSRKLVRKVGAASRAQGASETGLTQLIWLNAANMAADAMIAVCLAGTIFFSAATSQQRANVALYLVITMAPFALVAPVIGPVLDRLQHGRRWALAGTLLGRALLAYVMAANFHSIALYPAAFGTLVLAKAYGVLRAAAVPRVMPVQMTLVSANARLSIFGLAAATVAGLLIGGFIKVTGSYPAALWATAVVFVVGALLAVRLPRHVDSPEPAPGQRRPGAAGRLRTRFSLSPQVRLSVQATAAVRGLNGFLTLFMAFLIQSRLHGAAAAFELGAVVAAAGVGSLAGTTAGARLRLSRPDLVVLTAIGLSAGMCVLAAVTYGIQSAVLLALVVGGANSLAKLALDAIIQREVPEHLTASAFARSETVLQLAWVFGGALGIVLPSRGTVGFSVAAALLVAAFGYVLAARRNQARQPQPRAGRLDTDGYPAG